MIRNAIPIAAVLVAAVAAAQCGGAATTPTAPTTAVSTVTGVTLSAPTVIVGGVGQGTVTLMAAALTGGASIALSSSNPAVATVPATATIPVGSSSVSFSITAIAPGTATFIASINGSSVRAWLPHIGCSSSLMTWSALTIATLVMLVAVSIPRTCTSAQPHPPMTRRMSL
jgi:hypothetical protein